MEKLLNVTEASKYLGLHPKTVRKDFLNKGLIPVVSLGKGPRGDRIRMTDLEAFITERVCYYKEAKRGTSFSATTDAKLNELLGAPTKRKQRK